MSLVKDIQNQAIGSLAKTTHFGWIPYSQITDIESSQIDNIDCATHKHTQDDGTDDIITPWMHTYSRMFRTDKNELTRVTLKKIVDEGDDQLLDFQQVNYFTCKMQIVLLTCVSV